MPHRLSCEWFNEIPTQGKGLGIISGERIFVIFCGSVRTGHLEREAFVFEGPVEDKAYNETSTKIVSTFENS